VDLQHDWSTNIPQDALLAMQAWLAEQRRASSGADSMDVPHVDHHDLQGAQRDVFLQVMAWYHKKLSPGPDGPPPPLRINIDGTAGTGKSFLIYAISTALSDLANEKGAPDPLIRLAPTGIAAYNIRGWTLNSGLGIPVRTWGDLSGTGLARHQERLRDKSIGISDEKSMTGRTMAGKIDRRLRQAFPEFGDEIFGNMSMLLFGDFAQLPPIGDTPLYNDSLSTSANGLSNDGWRAFLALDQSVTLQTIFRQQGVDADAVAFKRALGHQRNYAIDEQDYAILSRRF
jgi:hypothetical protein